MKFVYITGLFLAAVCGAQDLAISNTTTNTVPPPVSGTNRVWDVQTNDMPSAVLSSDEVTPAVSAEDSVTNEIPAETISLPFEFAGEMFDDFGEPQAASDALKTLYEKLSAENSKEACRNVLIACLSEGQARCGTAILRKNLLERVARLDWADPVALDEILFTASCAGNLERFQAGDVSPDVWAWLFASNERVKVVAETLTNDDQTEEASRIIQKLYEHDPDGRDRFFNLIMARAVVWDTPRTEMHKQIGEGWLPPDKDICLYYDYFKSLFRSSQAKVAYDDLSVDSLVFVVDVPAPISELEWALQNVDGSRGLWGNHYKKIIYDDTRIRWKRYDWPHREYTLKEIQECFGICVDQAYYCVITARAHGIPSLYFHGRGKYGGHAWFGFMKKPTEWDMDVGRYSDQGYATGFAIHPQTDREMTDHELEYFCSRTLNPALSREASDRVYLAQLLHQEDCSQAALTVARSAHKIDPLCEDAWNVEYEVLVDTESLEKAIDLLKVKADHFRYFPDVVTDARQRQADLLSRTGDSLKAEKILALEVARVTSRRDDLQQELVLAQAEKLLEQGDAHKGLEVIERVLKEQRGGGVKIYPLILEYKKYAKKAGLSKNADRFLKTYYR